MANITNLFVRVKSERVNDFLVKHYSPRVPEGTTRSDAYDDKIVFLENGTSYTATGQIFTKDKLFSVSAADFDALKARAKALEDKVGSESVISQIQTEIAKLNLIIYSYVAGTDNFVTKIEESKGVVTAYNGTITIAKATGSTSYASVYQLLIDGQKVGEDINIPKDLLVQDAFTHTFDADVAKDAEFTHGSYKIKASQAYTKGDVIIVLVVNTAETGVHTFIQVKVTDLVNSYKADETTITLDTTYNTFSVKAGGIGSSQLDTTTNTYLSKTLVGSDFIVAGGPLANAIDSSAWPSEWIKDGNKIIPANASMEEIFKNLFLKTINGTVTLGEITWNPTLTNKPTVTLSASGTVEVGTAITLSYAVNAGVNDNTRSVTVTSDQGYFLNSDTTWHSGSYTTSKTGATKGDLVITSATWQGSNVTTLSSYVNSGTNTLSVTQQGTVAYVDALDNATVYASTNGKAKLSSVSVSVNDSKPADKTLAATSNSVSVNGSRYMWNGTLDASTEITSGKIREFTADANRRWNSNGAWTIAAAKAGYKIFLAAPAGTRDLASVKNVKASNAECKDSWIKQTVSVEGATTGYATDYDVWVLTVSAAFEGDETFAFTFSK